MFKRQRRPRPVRSPRRRLVRSLLVLLCALALSWMALDFPLFTAEQARQATERRYLYGPSELIAAVDYQRPPNTVWGGKYDRYYIGRTKGFWSWTGVQRDGLFWRTGAVEAVENHRNIPLIPLPLTGHSWMEGALLVFSNRADIASVEAEFPVLRRDSSLFELIHLRQDNPVDGCFVLSYDEDFRTTSFLYPEDARLTGYDAAGNLVWRSPTPDSWTQHYELTP